MLILVYEAIYEPYLPCITYNPSTLVDELRERKHVVYLDPRCGCTGDQHGHATPCVNRDHRNKFECRFLSNIYTRQSLIL